MQRVLKHTFEDVLCIAMSPCECMLSRCGMPLQGREFGTDPKTRIPIPKVSLEEVFREIFCRMGLRVAGTG